jgi:cytochrome c oxidase subunit 2
VRYLDPAGAETFTTANEIHIPVGQPVRVELTSPDVIHSFWVPRLAGKMDAIPGVKTVTWIEAAAPGRYRGQCAEYCGLQHARMAFYVVADAPPDFLRWRARQLGAPGAPEGNTAQGARLFTGHCASCHTIAGTSAGGIVGPDLSHLASRQTLAAGLIPNDVGHLSAWIDDPQAIKPGVLMPKASLTGAERARIVSYLESLS